MEGDVILAFHFTQKCSNSSLCFKQIDLALCAGMFFYAFRSLEKE